MRILFTFAGGSGHLEPLIPIAQAAKDAGHVVAFTGRPLMVPKVESLGFAAFASGSDRGLTPKKIPLVEIDAEQEIQAFGVGFGGRIARERARDILPLCAEWKPALLVCEETDFGAMVVAARLVLPYATVLVIAAGSFVRSDVVADPLNKVRAEHHLPPDPALAMPSRYLVLSPFPPSFRDPAFPLPVTAHSIRPFAFDGAVDDAMPPWSTRLDDSPTVYFTLGTVFPLESGDLFARVITGLRDLPINLVVTVGRDIDPADFGPQTSNVHIEQYIPQSSVLPHCDIVVSHGGSGSVIGALAHGLPMVLIPMGADQPLNTARCTDLGVARVLNAVKSTPEMVREAVSAVLSDPSYRRAAERMKDEIAAMPEPAHAIALLERLAAEKRPLLSK